MKPIVINQLKSWALKYEENPNILDDDIAKEEITKTFYNEIKRVLDRGELINWQVLGEVTSGKSAVMAHFVNHINGLLNKEMGLNRIFADQIEFREYLQKNDEERICVGIDEWNEMGTQGMNATTDDKFLTWTSDVMAQKFVHRISCSPETQVDRRANVILEVLGKDIERGITRCIVRYKLVKADYIKTQIVGYIDVPVINVLKREWYLRYRTRKMEKITLVRSKGISDPRTIEQAGLLVDLIDSLKEDARETTLDTGIISVKIEELKRKNSLYLSLITTNEIEKRAYALLKTISKISALENRYYSLRKKGDFEKAKGIERTIKRLKDLVQGSIDEQIRLKAVYDEYRSI